MLAFLKCPISLLRPSHHLRFLGSGYVLAHFGYDLEDARKALEENYNGCYSSLADYAEELTTETSEVSEHLALYIDYEKMGRDMELGGDVFTVETGYQEVHVFWSH